MAAAQSQQSQCVVTNQAYCLEVSVEDERVLVRLTDQAMDYAFSQAPYFYRASCAVESGVTIFTKLLGPKLSGRAQCVTVTGQLAGLDIEHSFTLPGDKPILEERIALRNPTTQTICLEDFEAGMLRPITDKRIHVLPELVNDWLVAIPFRHRATDPDGYDRDFSMDDLLTYTGAEHYPSDPFPQREVPSRHRYSEGWAWTHGDHTVGVFKFNQEAIEFSVVSLHKYDDAMALRLGGAAMIGGDPCDLRNIRPGETVALGVTRYETVQGGYTEACYAFRTFLDENKCRFPDNYDPPVHWNEIYDNPEWFLQTPGKPPAPRMTRPLAYTKDMMLEEATKAEAYGCQSLYLDPGWDTDFGTFLWGEDWLGPRKAFIDLVEQKHGLGVSLHCPVAPWMSLDGRGVHTWPRESFRMDADGNIIENSVCLGATQYLDEAAKRLIEHCNDGVVFLMLDGTWWNGTCYHPDHGHPIPYTTEDHCRACLDLAQRIHAKHPHVLIEMHDMMSGGSPIRYTPVYYKYGLPGSYDENWGLELMWETMADIKEGRARALFYYNLGCNVPFYLHVDLRDDNEHCLVLWWYASTNRHLGIGGTHADPQIAEAQKLAMRRYRRLERFYKRGEFYCPKQVGLIEPCRPEEIHLHVLPEENALVVNFFNLSDERRRITGLIPAADIGLDRDRWYIVDKGVGFNPATGWLHVDRVLDPWGTYVAEVIPLEK
ncbi:MAG TPA: hypothetical protein HPP77_01880 [Candidatus Hydrogenedentes bacterium]|nr:hypothetical protein [Candidatus Hydrogenedentota bacterium]